jgi:hypothetical protein
MPVPTAALPQLAVTTRELAATTPEPTLAEPEQPRVFRFTFAVVPEYIHHEDDPQNPGAALVDWARQLHLTRDDGAYNELFETIIRSGWTLGETLLNFPAYIHLPEGVRPEDAAQQAARDAAIHAAARAAARDDAAHAAQEAAAAIDGLKWKKRDLVVVTTRVPMDDEAEGGHQQIPRSYSRLENAIIETVRKNFFFWASRKQITLAESLKDFRKDAKIGKGNFEFNMRAGETIGSKKTMGFLVFAPRLNHPDYPKDTGKLYGPRLLASFAAAGVETLLWNRALRCLHKDLLSQIIKSDKYWCVIATWDPMKSPIPPRPRDLTFADDIKPHLDVACSEAPPCQEGAVWKRLRPWREIKGADPKNGAWQVEP